MLAHKRNSAKAGRRQLQALVRQAPVVTQALQPPQTTELLRRAPRALPGPRTAAPRMTCPADGTRGLTHKRCCLSRRSA